MSSTDHPSVLAVCVPTGPLGGGAVDIREILAARERAAAASQCIGVGPECRGSSSNCDSCDDSACGVDAVDHSSSASMKFSRSSLTGLNESNVNSANVSRAGVNSAAFTLEQMDSNKTCCPSFFHADSGKKALELLRMLHFDLLVTGDQLPDMPVGQLIRRVRAAWPWQKWAMVGSAISPQDEISARTLGAMAVFDAPPDWDVLGSLAAAAAGRAEHPSLRQSELTDLQTAQARDTSQVFEHAVSDRQEVSVANTCSSSRRGRSNRAAGRATATRQGVADRSVG